jgi:hypothetical protein
MADDLNPSKAFDKKKLKELEVRASLLNARFAKYQKLVGQKNTERISKDSALQDEDDEKNFHAVADSACVDPISSCMSDPILVRPG